MFALWCFLVVAKPTIPPTASIIIKIQPPISMLSFVCGDFVEVLVTRLLLLVFFVKKRLFYEIYGVTLIYNEKEFLGIHREVCLMI